MTPADLANLASRLGYSRAQMAVAAGVTTRSINRLFAGQHPVSETVALALYRHAALVEAGMEPRVPFHTVK